MAVLVTGGAGYIGSHMVWALLDAGEDVVVVDRLSTGSRWAVAPAARFYLGDVADRDLLGQIFEHNQIETIFHFAGSVSVPESISQPLEYYENNTGTTRALVAAAVGHGIRNFIFSSTAAVYGNQPFDGPVPETAVLSPENPYGLSKLASEIMLRDVVQAHDFNYVALRYFNVAGADPKGRAGPSPTGVANLIKVACEAATGRRDKVEVYGTDYPTADGTGVRDYIHVSDLIDAHMLAMAHLRAGGGTRTLNCGYGVGYSVLDVLHAVQRNLETISRLSTVPAAPATLPRWLRIRAASSRNSDGRRVSMISQPSFARPFSGRPNVKPSEATGFCLGGINWQR